MTGERSHAEMAAIMSPTPAKSVEDMAGTIVAWEQACERLVTRLGDDGALSAPFQRQGLIATLPAKLRDELWPHLDRFPTYAGLRNRIFELIHLRTMGRADMVLNLSH